jgi:large subunit ribosomal protein L19
MTGVIESLERAQLRRVPNFQAGDRVKVHFQVVEGTRRRTQVFEGVVIKRQGSGARETFTVRKQSFGVGVERTFPVHSPKIERVEVASRGDVRRAKLYYLRGRVGRRARVRERQYTGPEQERDALLMEPDGAFDAEGAQVEAEPVPDQGEAVPEDAEASGGDEAGAPAAAAGDESAAGEPAAAQETAAGDDEPAAEAAAEQPAAAAGEAAQAGDAAESGDAARSGDAGETGEAPQGGEAAAETGEESAEAGEADDAGSKEP